MGHTSSLDWRLDEHKDLPSTWLELETLIAKAFAEPEIPEWKRFAEMKALVLHGNDLVSIPPTIGRLSSLTTIILHSNKIEELPVEILELQYLQTLDVHNNQIRTLPEGLSVLISLRHIDVSFNQLSSLPQDFPVVVARLDTLHLNHNPFEGDLPLKSAIEKAEISAYRRLLGSGESGVNETEKIPTTKPTVPNVDLDAIARASGTTLTQSPRIAHKRRPPSRAHMEAQKIQAEEMRVVLSIEPDEDGQMEKKSERPTEHGSAPLLSSAPATDYQPVVPPNQMPAAGLADIMKSGIGGLKLRKPGVVGSIGSLAKSSEGLDQNPPQGSAPSITGGPLGSLKRVNGKEEATGNDKNEKEKEKEQEKEKEKERNLQNENQEKAKEKQQEATAPEEEKEMDRPIPKWKQKTASPPPSHAASNATSATSAPTAKPRPLSQAGETGFLNPKSPTGVTSPTVRPYRSNSNSSRGRKDKDVVNAKYEADPSLPPWKRELMERKAKAAAQK